MCFTSRAVSLPGTPVATPWSELTPTRSGATIAEAKRHGPARWKRSWGADQLRQPRIPIRPGQRDQRLQPRLPALLRVPRQQSQPAPRQNGRRDDAASAPRPPRPARHPVHALHGWRAYDPQEARARCDAALRVQLDRHQRHLRYPLRTRASGHGLARRAGAAERRDPREGSVPEGEGGRPRPRRR